MLMVLGEGAPCLLVKREFLRKRIQGFTKREEFSEVRLECGRSRGSLRCEVLLPKDPLRTSSVVKKPHSVSRLAERLRQRGTGLTEGAIMELT